MGIYRSLQSTTCRNAPARLALCLALTGMLATFLVPSGAAQEREVGWDVTVPRGETRTIDFTTDVGTWMSVDVSPDGEWIAFDLLSHVYRVPIEGGEAESLTQDSGIALNFHPRYSPDGRMIAFVSDRSGQNNLWVMDADGGNPRAVVDDPDVRVTEIAWTADGDIVANQSGGDRGGIWRYSVDGEEGAKLVEAGSWPSLSADGRYLYYQDRIGSIPRPGGGDLFRGLYQLRRLGLTETETQDIAVTGGIAEGVSLLGSSGGAIAPEISPDGRWLAFARRVVGGTISYKGHRYGPRTALWLRDLQTGEERMVMDPIEQDMAEGVKVLRVLPGYSWTPDGGSIVLSQGGRIRKLDVPSGRVATIPFTARVQRVVAERIYQEFRITDEPFEARYLRWHTASPDGDRLVFQAVGRIWVQELPRGEPRRLTQDLGAMEYGPVWSPDGRWIAFTTWDELEGGHVWRVAVPGGELERVSTVAGEYVNPAWSPDGRELVVARGSGATLRGRDMGDNEWFDVVRMPLGGDEVERVATVSRVSGRTGPNRSREVVRPMFGEDGRIYFTDREDGVQLVSVRPDGSERRVHYAAPRASVEDIVLSPDGRWVAFMEHDHVHIASVETADARDAKPEAVEETPAESDLDDERIDTRGGLYPRWRDDRTLEFGSGARYYVHEVETGRTEVVEVELQVVRDIPSGSVALTGGRIVTLDERRVLEEGTVVVEGSRIRCVGDCDLQGVDRRVDVGGATLVPGFVDTHAHHHYGYLGMVPARGWVNAIYLAYGVTATLDPAVRSRDVFTSAELIDAGRAYGPRTFSTGDSFGGSSAAISDPAAVGDQVHTLRSWGAIAIKQHGLSRRAPRQWIAEKAREAGLNVTAEGQDLNGNLALVMEGYTGIEHMFSYMPVYDDVARFLGQSGVCYNPTWLGAGPGPWDEEHFWLTEEVWQDAMQQRWVPWRHLAVHRRGVLRPESDYSFALGAQALADVIAEGGCGSFGGHFQQPGLATHWHIWSAARAMSPYEALRTATLGGAEALGLQADLGSIEPGKLADLVVLNSNPLDAIENTADLRYVMKGGVLYEATTLDELWPRERSFGAYPWLQSEVFRMDDRSVDYWDRRD